MVGTGSVVGERVVEAGVINLPGVISRVPVAGHAGTNEIVSKSMQKYLNEHKYRRGKPAAGLAGVEGVLALQAPLPGGLRTGSRKPQ